MVVNSIQSNNLGVIPQPAPQKPHQTAFAAGNEHANSAPSDTYSPTQKRQPAPQRGRGIGQFIFNFATFLGGAFAGDYAARKFVIKNRPMVTWKYMAIAIPFQLVAGSITQILANKLVNKN